MTENIAISVAAILSTVLSVYQEKIAKHYNKLSLTPEGRLYFSCIESALLPIGLFWFGVFIYPDTFGGSNSFKLYRMDFVSINPLDRTYVGDRMRYDGHLLDLPCCFQLSRRYLPPIRKFGTRSTELLPEYARRRLSTGHGCYVSSHDVRRSVKLFRGPRKLPISDRFLHILNRLRELF